MQRNTGTIYCLQCGYILSHLAGHQCPECGRPFNPDDPQTFRTRLRWRPRRVLAHILMAAVLIVAAVLGGAMIGSLVPTPDGHRYIFAPAQEVAAAACLIGVALMLTLAARWPVWELIVAAIVIEAMILLIIMHFSGSLGEIRAGRWDYVADMWWFDGGWFLRISRFIGPPFVLTALLAAFARRTGVVGRQRD